MKIVLSLLAIVAVLLAAALLLLRPPPGEVRPIEGLPWQIEPLADGSSRVFGVTLGRDTLGDARERLGNDMELAIVVKGAETGSLEMFYQRYNAGPLSGKLVLTGSVDEATLLQLRERSGAPRYLDSGARKYHLQPDDLPAGYRAPLQSITFIPVAGIDEDVALRRFGPAAETLRVNDETLHLLYPRLGLDLMINRKHRDVLQYVAPRDFERLRAPLLDRQAQPPAAPAERRAQ
jgi:hypothetical protein